MLTHSGVHITDQEVKVYAQQFVNFVALNITASDRDSGVNHEITLYFGGSTDVTGFEQLKAFQAMIADLHLEKVRG